MEIEVISKFEDFLKLEDIWNSVLEKSQNDKVFLTFEWFRAWWIGFGKNKTLFILLLKNGDSVIGMAPFMLTKAKYRGFPIKKIEFIHNENSPRNNFIVIGDLRANISFILKFLKENQKLWDIVELSNIEMESPILEVLRDSLIDNRMLFGIRGGLRSPYIKITTDWQTYFSKRSKKFHKVLRNKMNRINKEGEYSINRVQNLDDIDRVMLKVFSVSNKSWKEKCKVSMTSNEENKIFFDELTSSAGQRGWLDIWLLNINGKSIAYEYHLRYKNRIYALRADFDEAYKDSSPGSVLDMHVVKAAFENNLSEYDMCGSDDPYKKNWTSDIQEHCRFIIYQNSFFGKIIYILEFKIIRFIRKIRKLSEKYCNKVKEIYTQKGCTGLFIRILRKIIFFIFNTNSAIWYEKKTTEIKNFYPDIPVNFDINTTMKTINWIKKQKETWLIHPKEITAALKNEHYYPAVYCKGDMIGFAKIGLGDTYIVDFNRAIKFPKQMAFIYDTYVIPEYRGKGIGPYLIAESIKFLNTKGFRKVRCHIPPRNIASIRMYSKIGFKRINFIRCFRVFNLTLLTANPFKK